MTTRITAMISIMTAIAKTISTTQHNLLVTFFSMKVHCFGLEDELGQDIEAVVEEEEEIDFLCLWQVRSFYDTLYYTSFCLCRCLLFLSFFLSSSLSLP